MRRALRTIGRGGPALTVDPRCGRLVVLGSIDGGVGGAVDDDGRRRVTEDELDRLRVTDVEDAPIAGHDVGAIGMQQLDDVGAQLAGGAGDQPPRHVLSVGSHGCAGANRVRDPPPWPRHGHSTTLG